MYHEITPREVRARRRKAIVIAIVMVVVIALAIPVGFAVRDTVRQQGALTLRDTIVTAAKECCAVEGSYPMSLAYLEEHYGVIVNRNDYVVTYEAFTGNMMPSVVVMVK